MRQIISPLDGIRSPFGARSGFSPVRLFGLNEPGIWLDPSDVANLDWRRNLLTYTEQFDNAVWIKLNILAFGSGSTANSAVAPDGTNTADLIVPDTSSNQHGVYFSAAAVAGTRYTHSFYAKAAGYDWFYITEGNNVSAAASFNLATGTVGTVAGTGSPVATITSVGNGWYRCTLSLTPISTVQNVQARAANANGGPTFAGNGTSGVLIWGAQLELGSVATDYQRISDVNTEVLERFPTTTMYQDRAGSTAVTTPGQSVGLRLDKSKGLVLGSELVTNGAFDSGLTGWTSSPVGTGTATVVNGQAVLQFNTSANRGRITQQVTTVAGRYYEVLLTVVSGTPNLFVGTTTTANDTFAANSVAAGTYQYIVAAGSAFWLTVIPNPSSTVDAAVDNISVKELPGNHAVANSDAARGIYGIEPVGGRRNLLLASDIPVSSTFVSVTANAATAPDGTNNAARVTKTDSTTPRYTSQMWASAASLPNTAYTVSRYVKYDGFNTTVSLEYNTTTTFDLGWVATFSVTASGVTADTPSLCTSAVQDVGNGWYRIRATFTSGASPVASITPMLSRITGASGVSVLMYGAQIELGSTATAYQRVTDQYNVTEAGKQTLHYVQYDGSDDGYVTPTISPNLATSDGAARRNLLTFPSAFDDAVWVKTSLNVTANAAVAPDGTMTADKLIAVASNSFHFADQTVAMGAVAHTASAYFKAAEYTTASIFLTQLGNNGAVFDLNAGTVSSVTGTGNTAAITPAGNGWYRCSVTNNGSADIVDTVRFGPQNGSIAAFTGDGTSGILFWGGQLELGTTATTFQNIGTDKVQVFAGVRKLSDAAVGVVAEFSSVFTNPGSFVLRAPKTAGVANYDFISGGTASGVATAPSTFASPITNILTGLGDISGDIATIRANGAQVAQATSDQGTGNFLAYPLYIGRRAATSLPFNGRDYGICVRFGANLDSSTISATEAWLAGKTGVTL